MIVVVEIFRLERCLVRFVVRLLCWGCGLLFLWVMLWKRMLISFVLVLVSLVCLRFWCFCFRRGMMFWLSRFFVRLCVCWVGFGVGLIWGWLCSCVSCCG